jgi:hypothetical protein
MSGIRRCVEELRRPMSLRSKLLIAVNTALLVGLSALLVMDYRWGLAQRLRNKQIAMSEEAALILPAIHPGRSFEVSIDPLNTGQETIPSGRHFPGDMAAGVHGAQRCRNFRLASQVAAQGHHARMPRFFPSFFTTILGLSEEHLVAQIQFLRAENQILRLRPPSHIRTKPAERARLIPPWTSHQ